MSLAHTHRLPTGAQPHTWGLIGWLALCVGGGALIGVVTSGGGDPWYLALNKPTWNPPSWVFGPVWTTLYALMGTAAWRVWRRGGWSAHATALGLFVAQLALNFAWSFLFFTMQQPVTALADIVALLLTLVLTAWAFFNVDRLAAWLLMPYLAWVSFATVLNATIVAMN